jgi:[ribosomal protein S18]-alanine N-acetyltransferase
MSAADLLPGLRLRPMQESDLAGVMACERAAYELPWEEEAIRECLRVGYNCWVADLGGEIAGHGILSIGAAECHVLNLCVRPDCQRIGLGRRLLRELMELAKERGADTAFLEVRVSNDRARSLYASEGFCEIATRRGYYPARNGREDAVVLARSLR